MPISCAAGAIRRGQRTVYLRLNGVASLVAPQSMATPYHTPVDLFPIRSGIIASSWESRVTLN